MTTALHDLNQDGNTVVNVALSPSDDSWVIIYDTNKWQTSSNISSALSSELTRLRSAGETIKGVALGTNGQWLVIYGSNSFTASNIPTAMYNSLVSLQTAGQYVRAVAMGPSNNSWVILYGQNYSSAASIPTSLYNQLKGVSSGTLLTGVALGPNDSWVLTANTNDHWYSSVPGGMSGAFDTITDYNYLVSSVALGASGSYVVTYGTNGWYASATRSVGSKHENPHR